jgi:two-component system sensor kinase FixL
MAEENRTSRALRTLELNEARWQAILDTARDPIICIDVEGIVTLFNRAAESIFGYSATEVVGRNVKMLMPAPYRDEHDGYIMRYRTTGTAKAIGRIREVQAQRKSGEVFPIELSISEARVGDDVIYSAIIRDVSERRAMESDLVAARRLAQERERLADVGSITARIVHDLGNPLAGISMQASLIHRRATRDPDRPSSALVEPARQILEEVRRLDRLVREFLDFTRQQRLDLRTVALAPFLRRIVDLWQPVAAERSIDLTLDAPSNGPATVNADTDKLRRVVENLVKNAVEAIDHGPGRINLSLAPSTKAKYVRIAIRDSGPGIAENVEMFRLFETTKPHGSGLGLSIAKQIVIAHGGDIGYERLEPHGTLFYVDLPTGPSV